MLHYLEQEARKAEQTQPKPRAIIENVSRRTFVGALATEDVRAPFAPGPLVPRFIGAADIGDISTVIFPTSGSSGAFPFAPIAAGCPI